MSLKATIRWKAISLLPESPPINKENVVFKLSPNTGLYSQFSLPLSMSYVPYVLSPTITYHQVMRNLLKGKNIELQDRRYPYNLSIPGIGQARLNLTIRLFPPNIVTISIVLSQLSDFPKSLNVAELIECQKLEQLNPIYDITQWTIGLVETLNQKHFERSQSFRSKPALHLDYICEPGEFREHFDQNASKYVGILIRNQNYEAMRTPVVSRMLGKNEALNEKSYMHEQILVDKQGILFLTSGMPEQEGERRAKLSKFHDLYEIGMVFGAHFDEFLRLRSANEDFADFIFYRCIPWINEPEVVFKNSVSNRYLWELLLDELALRPQFRFISKNQTVMMSVMEKSRLFDKFAVDWWQQKDFPYLLTRTIKETQQFDLSFLENEELRRIVIEDYQEARRSFEAKNYKATNLLCGSIAEALLAAAIDKAKIIPTKKIYENSNLATLIDTASNNGLIRDSALLSLLRPLREYRNMIHPGVQVRKQLVPDASKSKIALETIALLVRELGRTTSAYTK